MVNLPLQKHLRFKLLKRLTLAKLTQSSTIYELCVNHPCLSGILLETNQDLNFHLKLEDITYMLIWHVPLPKLRSKLSNPKGWQKQYQFPQRHQTMRLKMNMKEKYGNLTNFNQLLELLIVVTPLINLIISKTFITKLIQPLTGSSQYQFSTIKRPTLL